MAPKGYISLGPYNDIRPVIAKDLREVPMDTANPFAAPSGGNKGYNDLTGWAEFTMNDWQVGAGENDPESGGYLCGISESRIPSQLILSSRVYSANNVPLAVEVPIFDSGEAGYPTYGPTGSYGTKIASKDFDPYPGVGYTATNRVGSTIFFKCLAKAGTTFRVSIYTGATVPTTEVAYVDAVPAWDGGPLPRWIRATITNGSGLNTAGDWIVITPSVNTCIIRGFFGAVGFAKRYQYGSWFDDNNWSFISPRSMTQDTAYGAGYVRFGPFAQRGNTMYAVHGTKISKWIELYHNWDEVDDPGVTLSLSIAVFDNEVYFARPAGNAYKLTAAEAHVNLTYPAQLFYSEGSYLWKVNGTTISYSADATTWTDVANATTESAPVLAMAAMAGTLYYATKEGVFYIAPGDFCRKLFLFPTNSTSMPVQMLEYQGNLYVVGGNQFYRIDPGGSILPLHVPTGDVDLVEEGKYVHSVTAGLDWLYVGTSNEAGDRGLIWSWQPEGWHIVALVPCKPSFIHVNTYTKYIFVSDVGHAFYFKALDGTRNPIFNPVNERDYEAHAWVTTDKFFGPNITLDKDFESVYVDFEGHGGDNGVSIFYTSDRSNGWVRIGSLAASGELRLSNFATTPRAFKWMRLGIGLWSNYDDLTPRVRAVSVKYTPMVSDRWRWRLDLTAPPRLSDVDGELYTGTYNQASMLAHIKACITSTVPIIFYDVDGSHYEVKVVAASRSIQRVEAKRGGTKDVSYTWSLTLEQVMTGTTSY